MKPNQKHESPVLPEQCTVQDLYLWLIRTAEHLPLKDDDLPDMKELFDEMKLAPGDIPTLTHKEIAVLVLLSGKIKEGESWLQTVIPLLAVPEPLRQIVEMDLPKCTFRIAPGVKVKKVNDDEIGFSMQKCSFVKSGQGRTGQSMWDCVIVVWMLALVCGACVAVTLLWDLLMRAIGI